MTEGSGTPHPVFPTPRMARIAGDLPAVEASHHLTRRMGCKREARLGTLCHSESRLLDEETYDQRHELFPSDGPAPVSVGGRLRRHGRRSRAVFLRPGPEEPAECAVPDDRRAALPRAFAHRESVHSDASHGPDRAGGRGVHQRHLHDTVLLAFPGLHDHRGLPAPASHPLQRGRAR